MCLVILFDKLWFFRWIDLAVKGAAAQGACLRVAALAPADEMTDNYKLFA
jgi:hypothetical protein